MTDEIIIQPDSANKPLRPAARKYKPGQVAAALIAADGLISHAARNLGCTPATIRRYIRVDDAVRTAYEDAREALLDDAESVLAKAVRAGNLQSTQFLLRTVGKHRGYADNAPSADVTITDVRPVAQMSDDELLAIIAGGD